MTLYEDALQSLIDRPYFNPGFYTSVESIVDFVIPMLSEINPHSMEEIMGLVISMLHSKVLNHEIETLSGDPRDLPRPEQTLHWIQDYSFPFYIVELAVKEYE